MEEGLYYPCSENKGDDQLCITAKLICVFVFAYAKSRFSHDAAQIQTSTFYHGVIPLNDLNRIANSEDPDQTAPPVAV